MLVNESHPLSIFTTKATVWFGHVSLKEISGFQPNLAAALAGFPSRVSTFAGL